MKVELLAYTPNADAICAAAGNSCYSSKPASEIMGGIDSERILSKVVGMGHHSVVEHATFTFSVEGVSRALTHQLVRHRIASFSQQSQRYVSLKDPSYVRPHTVENNPDASKIFDETMDRIWEAYRALEEMGVPAEDARYLLPNGCTTNIVVTMNARELLHFFSLRCCGRAQWEIREMAEKMLALCVEVSPAIFSDAGPPCMRGPCPEGKLSCGKPRRSSDRAFRSAYPSRKIPEFRDN
jgi:thymidylate synthase (FAD)